MTDTVVNRHGDTIRIGQLWTDDPRRTVRRTLRVDGVTGTGVVCTVIRAHDTDTGQITAPGRVVTIKADSLHTTAGGRGYRLAAEGQGVSAHCDTVRTGPPTSRTGAKEDPVHQISTPRRWAEAMLAAGAACIVDVETSGLTGSILEIAAIDAATGAVLLDTLVDCTPVPIEPAAHAVHGITAADLAGAPRWPQVCAQLREVTAGRRILAYNAEFDRGRILADCTRFGLDPAHLADPDRWQCVMARRCDALGLGPGGRLRLDGGHRALADVHATRALVMLLAAGGVDHAGQDALAGRTPGRGSRRDDLGSVPGCTPS